MTAPSNGVYNIQNVGTQNYMDLSGSSGVDGTLIIGFTLNQKPSGTPNQQFTLTLLPGTSVFTLRAVNPASWVRIKNDSFVQNNNLIGSASSTPFSIEPAGGGNYKIKIPNIDLCCALKSPDLRASVVLAPSDGSNSQLWTLIKV